MTGITRRRAASAVLCTIATVLAAVIGLATVQADPDPSPAPGDAARAAPGPVPTVDEAVAVLDALTDPNIPAANKSNLVTAGFSAEESETIDTHLSWFSAHGYLPFAYTVTNIQPAPNDLAGTTVTIARPWTPPGPVVFSYQDGHWLVTHDTAITMLRALWSNTHGGGGGGVFGGGGNVPSIISPVFGY